MAYGYNVGGVNPTSPNGPKGLKPSISISTASGNRSPPIGTKPVGNGLMSPAGLADADIGNVEFVELFGGRNGVIFYGSDGYSTTQVMAPQILSIPVA